LLRRVVTVNASIQVRRTKPLQKKKQQCSLNVSLSGLFVQNISIV